MSRSARLLGLMGAAALVICAYMLRPQPNALPPDAALIPFVIGGVLIGVAQATSPLNPLSITALQTLLTKKVSIARLWRGDFKTPFLGSSDENETFVAKKEMADAIDVVPMKDSVRTRLIPSAAPPLRQRAAQLPTAESFVRAEGRGGWGVRWFALIAGIALMGLFAEISGQIIFKDWGVSQHVQFALFVVATALIAVGLTGVDPRRFALTRPVVTPHHLALIAVIVLAFVLRAADLERIRRFVDEIHYLDAITRLWDNPNTPLLVPFSDVTAFTWFFPYLQQLPVALAGSSLASFRFTSVLFGTATVGAVYLFTRALTQHKETALIAALLLAVLPPHLQFSRIALSNIADPLFGTLALAFLLRARADGRRADWVLAGIMLGLTQYFYEGGRLLYPVVAGVWLGIMFLTQRRRDAEERQEDLTQRHEGTKAQRGEDQKVGFVGTRFIASAASHFKNVLHSFFSLRLCVSALKSFLPAFLLTAFPVYYTLIGRGMLFTTRLSAMSVTTEMLNDYTANYSYMIGNLLRRPLLAYVTLPESGWFYGGNTALVLWVVAPLLLIGLWVALWRVRQPPYALLLIWFAGATLGNLLMRDLWSARFAVVLPALAALMALGASWLYRLFTPAAPNPASPLYTWRRIMLLIPLLALCGAQVGYYFGEHLQVYQYQYRNAYDVDDALLRAMDLPANTQAYIVSEAVIFRVNIDAVLHFWRREDDLTLESMGRMWLTDDFLSRLDPDKHHAFFVEPGSSYVTFMLRRYFALLPAPQTSPYPVPPEYQFELYFFERGGYRPPEQ